MLKKSTTRMLWLSALLLASPIAVRPSQGFEATSITYVHWIFHLVDAAGKSDSEQARRELVDMVIATANERGYTAREMEGVKRDLERRVRDEGDSPMLRDVITTLGILIHTKRGETFEPPYEALRAYPVRKS